MDSNQAKLLRMGGPVLIILIALVFLMWTSFSSIENPGGISFQLPGEVKDFTTIFLSIFLETIPFILLGVFLSSAILVYVSEDKLQRLLPRNPLLAIFPAVLLAAFFPVCECAIIPVVKRLIQKGMAPHIGIVFLIVTPLVNPIVYLSTHLAFRLTPSMVYGRMGLAIVVAIIASLLVYFLFNRTTILKGSLEQWVKASPQESEISGKTSKFQRMLYHATDEFFDVSKFVIFGALLAAFAQISLNRAFLGSFSDNIVVSSLLMMGLAFLLSICSEADAFIGSSFSSLFPPGAILAFLVFGAIFDVKNTMMMFSVFRAKFVLFFMGIIGLLVLGGSIFFQYYIK